jgi:hypothetical protein
VTKLLSSVYDLNFRQLPCFMGLPNENLIPRSHQALSTVSVRFAVPVTGFSTYMLPASVECDLHYLHGYFHCPQVNKADDIARVTST